MTFKNTLALAIAGALTLSPLALAQDSGNAQPGRFAVNIGGAHLSPSNDTGALADGALEASIDGGNGVQIRYQDGDVDGYFYMAGQSYGNNHVLVIADSGEEIEDFEQILSDQLEKLEAELS